MISQMAEQRVRRSQPRAKAGLAGGGEQVVDLIPQPRIIMGRVTGLARTSSHARSRDLDSSPRSHELMIVFDGNGRPVLGL